MKATKIVGVVLGVLMVAALSTGAVAALSDNEVSLGDVYTNYLYDNDYFIDTYDAPFTILEALTGWTNVDTGATVSFTQEVDSSSDYYIADSAAKAADSTLPGTYSKTIGNKTYLINVKYPGVVLTGIVYNGTTADSSAIANLLGGTANTDNGIMIEVTAGELMYEAALALTNPDKTFTNLTAYVAGDDAPASVKDWDLGVWTVCPVFSAEYGNFATLAPTYMYGVEQTFTLISADTSKKLEAGVESVTQGGYVTITLTAPYGEYIVSVDKEATIPGNQPSVETADELYDPTTGSLYALVSVGTSGKQTFVVQSQSTNDFKVTLYNENSESGISSYDQLTVKKQITVKVTAGAITAEAEKESVYIGDEFDIEGTNDLGKNVYFYVKGTNYPLTIYPGECGSGKVWDATIDTAKLTSPDAGVYTIYVAKPTDSWYNSGLYLNTSNTDDFDNTSRFDAYTTISVSLIQPFITANVENGVVVQGDKLEVTGTAEGTPADVKLYVFGTNFFATDKASVLDDGTYSYSHKIIATDKEDGDAWKMATGQYFLVVQHPMYDKTYNIGPLPADDLTEAEAAAAGNYNIVLNESGSYADLEGLEMGYSKIIFNTLSRQSSNAAQALIDAIGSQNIDDMQAHLSFIVTGPTSYVNAVPSQVTKGQALTISGTTTGHKNEMVAVELLSTAFAAVPKETVGSAAFATLTTRIGDDGVWSVSFDTSNLNADDYTVSIAVGSLDPVTAKTTIVEGSTPSVTPTTDPTVAPTVAPTAQPTTTPSTPGFGALAALAGLGAVAVLLLRRE